MAIPESLGFCGHCGTAGADRSVLRCWRQSRFALFTSSKHLVIAGRFRHCRAGNWRRHLAVARSPHYAAVIALLGVPTGLILVAMGLLRFGFLADLVSKPVLTGFGGRWSAAYPDPWPGLISYTGKGRRAGQSCHYADPFAAGALANVGAGRKVYW